MKYAVVVAGLGYGDEGKGATVDWLSREHHAGLVVRYSGGAQAGHNVVLPDGRHHCFSQWGSGTFTGADTWLDRDVIIDPLAMVEEAKHLHRLGLKNPWAKLFVHPHCLVTTPYHRVANRMSEHKRGTAKHGSCGMGIGETRRLWRDRISLQAMDLKSKGLIEDKLWLIRTVLRDYLLEEVGIRVTEFDSYEWPDNFHDVVDELFNSRFQYARESILSNYYVGIFEGAQGFLLDEVYGEQPHTTWSTVTTRNALERLEHMKISYKVLGVTRSYATRHGKGPIRCEIPDCKIEDKNNPHNFQGAMRFGILLCDELKVAVAVNKVDSLVVTHMDRMPASLRMQNGIVREFASEDPFIESLSEQCGKPVSLISRGPTYEDREALLVVSQV